MNENISKIMNNKVIYVILIIGVVFMLFIGGGGDKTEKTEKKSTVYSDEKRLADIISDIKGAGKVSVMITYYESAEKDLAYEIKQSENTKKGDNSQNDEKTVDKQAVMSDGEPMVVKEIYPKVKGVIVTAEGAGNYEVKQHISEAVQSVLDVPAHRVCVFEKKY
ncbi:MAG: hypothetical protein N2171_05835 [Clostridia bacterium]|nr:hypothetical protein [Clostridia bacterium]